MQNFTRARLLSTLVVLGVLLALQPLPKNSRSAGEMSAVGRRAACTPPEAHASTEGAADHPAQRVELVGQLGGQTYALAVHGTTVYLGVGPRLVLLDLSAPVSPRLLGQSAPLGAHPHAIAVSGHYIYVAVGRDRREPAGPSGLHILDVSNPAQPRVVGAYESRGYAVGVALAGTFAYLIEASDRAGAPWTDAGLRILDVSTPSAPRSVGFFHPGAVGGMAVAGATAYVAAGALYVLDISDPAHPTEIARYQPPGRARAVALAGTLAYVTTAEFARTHLDSIGGGLRVVDIGDPVHPTELGVARTGAGGNVAVSGTLAYVAAHPEAAGAGVPLDLRVVDVSNAANPAVVGPSIPGSPVFDVQAVGSTVYVAQATGLRILDMSDVNRPVEVGRFVASPLGRAAVRAFAGTHAYAVTAGTVYVLDVTCPSEPQIVGTHPIRRGVPSATGRLDDEPPGDGAGADGGVGGVMGLALAGSYVHVAEGRTSDGNNQIGAGLRILDVADPKQPREVSFTPLATMARPTGLAVAGTRAYVTLRGELQRTGLLILDISNPRVPTEAGFIRMDGEPSGVAVQGTHVYVTSSGGVFTIMDVSHAVQPVAVASLKASAATAVLAHGRFAYVSDFAQLHIIDIGTPAAPVEVGTYPGAGYRAASTGTYAFLAGQVAGVHVVDVRDPVHPRQVGSFDTTGPITHIGARGEYAYITDLHGGLFVLRVADAATNSTAGA